MENPHEKELMLINMIDTYMAELKHYNELKYQLKRFSGQGDKVRGLTHRLKHYINLRRKEIMEAKKETQALPVQKNIFENN